jgi:hypothetical protein
MSYLENSGKYCSRAQLLPNKRGRTVADYRGRSGATWSDAVVIFPGEVLAFQNIERARRGATPW